MGAVPVPHTVERAMPRPCKGQVGQGARLPRRAHRQTSVSQRTVALAVLRHGGGTVRSRRTCWATAFAHRAFSIATVSRTAHDAFCFGGHSLRARAPVRVHWPEWQRFPAGQFAHAAGINHRRRQKKCSVVGLSPCMRAAVMDTRPAFAVARTRAARRPRTREGACGASNAALRAALRAVRARRALCPCVHPIGDFAPGRVSAMRLPRSITSALYASCGTYVCSYLRSCRRRSPRRSCRRSRHLPLPPCAAAVDGVE